VKLSAPCHKSSYRYEKRYVVGKIHSHFSCFATWCLLVIARVLVDESGVIRTGMGMHNTRESQ
jgi:hypothetical protein